MLSESDRVAEIRTRLCSAPVGPYTVGTSDTGALLIYIPGTAPLYIGDMAETVAADHALADFLAGSWQDITEVLAMLEAKDTECQTLKAQLTAAESTIAALRAAVNAGNRALFEERRRAATQGPHGVKR